MSGPAGRPRALVLRAIGLGDLLAGVPALRALRRALPGHELVLAAPAALGPLVELVDAVDTHLPTGELQPVPWTGPPPDVAVDLHGNGPASKVLLEVLHPGRLVAFAGPGGDGTPVPGPEWRADEHERERWCRLVVEGLRPEDRPADAADPDDVRLDVPAREPVVHGACVLHVGAASRSRRWPPERFAEVARWTHERGERVVLTGSAAEAPEAAAVAAAAGLPQGAVLAGRTDLADLAALVAAARLVVSGDTGTAHLASAYGVPSVVLFGPVSPAAWGPPAGGPHTVLWHGTGDGDPHGDEVDPALLRVDVGEVLAAADLRLRRAAPPAPDPSRPARPRSTARSA